MLTLIRLLNFTILYYLKFESYKKYYYNDENLFLDFKNVEIKQQNNTILSGVNLNINQGEFVYFVGKTGSGKSSLLKAIYGDVAISGGDISFKNQSLKKLKREKILALEEKLE